ncbi:MAG: hypothetical protein Q8Q48_03720 [Candidatus Staskawiczbacteria bacterium]|nr:hypothetical protein [Candidatus Staskawiczbacteria bacterium]
MWVAEDELDKIISKDKGKEDSEIKAIKKGFEILKGSSLRTS